MDPFLGFVNKMMEVREADMAKREAYMMERMRLEVVKVSLGVYR